VAKKTKDKPKVSGAKTGRVNASKPNKANTPKSEPFKVPEFLSHREHADLKALCTSNYNVIVVRTCTRLKGSSCGWDGRAYADDARDKRPIRYFSGKGASGYSTAKKYSVYRYDGSLMATSENE
jgi:hypothetical protein